MGTALPAHLYFLTFKGMTKNTNEIKASPHDLSHRRNTYDVSIIKPFAKCLFHQRVQLLKQMVLLENSKAGKHRIYFINATSIIVQTHTRKYFVH